MARRLDQNGKALWTDGGIAITRTLPSNEPGASQVYPRAVADGKGGVIVVWVQDDVAPAASSPTSGHSESAATENCDGRRSGYCVGCLLREELSTS
jgi:hypothetical protein